MDYKQEQSYEIEALDSIYCGEFEVISTEPVHKFAIPVKSEGYDDKGEEGLACVLKFEYTPKYPDEPPDIEVQDAENFENVDTLTEHLQQIAQENLGMVMIFTLVSAAQEWLSCRYDENKLEKEKCETERKNAEEEAERRRFEGTRVTVDSFLNWKRNYDEELALKNKKEKEDKDSRKLTGKELFMRDKTLNESDLKFLEEGDDVKVDESLFEDLDDLELDDDDDEDES